MPWKGHLLVGPFGVYMLPTSSVVCLVNCFFKKWWRALGIIECYEMKGLKIVGLAHNISPGKNSCTAVKIAGWFGVNLCSLSLTYFAGLLWEYMGKYSEYFLSSREKGWAIAVSNINHKIPDFESCSDSLGGASFPSALSLSPLNCKKGIALPYLAERL